MPGESSKQEKANANNRTAPPNKARKDRKEAGPGIEYTNAYRLSSTGLSVVKLKGSAVLAVVHVRVVGVPIRLLHGHGQGIGVVVEALSRVLSDRGQLRHGSGSIVGRGRGVALEGGDYLGTTVLNKSIICSGLGNDDVVTVTVYGVLEGHICLGRGRRIGLP